MDLVTSITTLSDQLGNPAIAFVLLVLSVIVAITAFRAIKASGSKASTKPANKKGKVFPDAYFYCDAITLSIAAWFIACSLLSLANYGMAANGFFTIIVSAVLCLVAAGYWAKGIWDKERLSQKSKESGGSG